MQIKPKKMMIVPAIRLTVKSLTVKSLMVKDPMLFRTARAAEVILPAAVLAAAAVQILITPLLLR